MNYSIVDRIRENIDLDRSFAGVEARERKYLLGDYFGILDAGFALFISTSDI